MTHIIEPQELEILSPAANQGYGAWPLPSERDQQIKRLIDRLLEQANRTSVGRILAADRATVLLAFAERMASLAVREHSRQDVHYGLVAASIAASLTTDVREAIMVLPLLWRSMEILDLDPKHELALVVEQVNGDKNEFLESFANRSAQDRSIQAMGYIEGMDESGFRYHRTW